MDKRKKGVTDKIPKEALKIIKDNKIKVGFALHHKEEEVKYESKTFLRVYQGYDAFENFMVTRHFIQEKFNVTIHELEALLYLYPKQYFTSSDYMFFPRKFQIRTIRVMLVKGFITWVMKPKNIVEPINYKKLDIWPDGVFTLSARSKTIVTTFYKCLCGEQQMNVDELSPRKNNVYRTSRNRMIKTLYDENAKEHQQERSPYKKALYKKNSDL